MRLSRMRVVFPDPETPVIAVMRPRGIFTESDFTVCRGSVFELDGAFLEHDLVICTFAHMYVLCAREIGPDAGSPGLPRSVRQCPER